MKITILVVGKTEKGFVRDGVEEYLKRLKHYIKTDIVVIPDIKNSKNLTVNQLVEREEALIFAALGNSDGAVLLDEKGKGYSSTEFSDILQAKMLGAYKEIIFIIGGAYGVSDEVKQRVKAHISLSKLTFSHQMVRLILVEQIYRAMTILRGEPYHHS